MNTIKQNVNIEFIKADAKDVIKLLRVMNNLVETINHNKSVDKYESLTEERDKYKKLYKMDSYIYYEDVEYLYDFLVKAGLASSVDILEEGNPLIEIDSNN